MRYRVRGRSDGGEQTLDIEADDEAQVRSTVEAMGMELLEILPDDASGQGRGVGLAASLAFRKPVFDSALFTQELIALLDAGLSLVETVETLRDKSAQGINRTVLTRIVSALYEGLPLSKALEQQPEQFPVLYVATVASAERTGALSEALKRYHHYDARLAVVRKKVVSSMVYPVIVIAAGTLIILFLAFYVVPKFSSVYESMKDIPASARVMLWWGRLVHAHGMVLLLGIVVTLAGLVMGLRTGAARAWLRDMLTRLPKVATYQHLFVLTRFYRTMGLLLSGGMPVVAAMEMSAQLLPATMRPSLARALEDIRAGKSLSAALPAAGLTTPVAERLIRVGEQSGELPKMVTRSAEFCDEELDRAIDTLMRVFEPVLMLVVGGIVGTVIFLLYMPIFQLAGSVG
ncbi:type II secretion system F family protein [Cupriavidus plantarum]|uniref:type II secretion system F family protein n=1 Tax=Cupriavidus plantarum TaxID=942865 RepID=UPI0015C6F6E4|nr:type II secretion system F family protein [Cupriavidus plantarum]NYI00746.1 general secretion pathway protein F [Cupriavidus plantarum]